MDTYIRAYMDESGYVPISLVCGYPNVGCYGALYIDIVARLKELDENSVIEIDAENETVRLKAGWDMVRINTSPCLVLLICIVPYLMFHSG